MRAIMLAITVAGRRRNERLNVDRARLHEIALTSKHVVWLTASEVRRIEE